jgi:hypothetical protein
VYGTIVAQALAFALLAASEEKAVLIAHQMMEALGGQERWEQARFLHFTYVRQGRRLTLSWDRHTGRYRLEGMNDTGVPYVVVMNLNSRQGRAALEGRVLEGAELSEYLNLATRVWTGETYWLLAPYKLQDPGAILTYEGEESEGGIVRDRLHLRFENVGLTPKDQFWLYVNRETHLLDRWRFKLQGGAEGDFRWTGWQRFGGILLATERIGANGERIVFEDIIVTDSMPDDVFTSLQPLAFR